MSAELGKTSCVNMVLSGTASGVIGGAFVARACGVENAVTLDIGGTSADVAVVIDGAPQYGMGEKIGEFPLYIPSVSVTSIGEGGGSIARVDEFGVLKVGPESAGSDRGRLATGRAANGQRSPTPSRSRFLGITTSPTTPLPSTWKSPRRHGNGGGPAWPLSRGDGRGDHPSGIAGMYMEINKLTARYGIDIRDFALVTFGARGRCLAAFSRAN